METTEPRDHRTHSFAAGMQYRSPLLHANLEYRGSLFQNRNPTLTWDNPFMLGSGNGALNIERGRFALAPDNHMHNIRGDGSVRLLEWTNEESVRVLRGHLMGVESVTFSADGNSLISLGSDHPGDGVRFWDVETGECYGGIDLPITPDTSLHGFAAGSRHAALAFGDPPVVTSFLWNLEGIGSPPGSLESEKASGADSQ